MWLVMGLALSPPPPRQPRSPLGHRGSAACAKAIAAEWGWGPVSAGETPGEPGQWRLPLQTPAPPERPHLSAPAPTHTTRVSPDPPDTAERHGPGARPKR